MRIFLSTIGSHGDVHPFLALGRALIARGHEVTLLVHPHFHGDARDAGIEAVAIAPELDVVGAMKDPDLMHPRRGGKRVFQLIFGGAPSACRTLEELIDKRRPDAFVCHHICFGMRWVAERKGVPTAHCVLAPQLWLNPRDAVHPMQKSPGGAARFAAITLGALLRPLVPLMFDRPFNALRRELGFPKGRDWLWQECRAGDVNLGLWSPHFRGPYEGDPERGVICGFPWHDRSHSQVLPDEVERFLNDGEPPLVFSLGTAVVHAPGDFYEVAVSAAKQLNRRAILLTGSKENRPRDLPKVMVAVGYAPFSLLMPRSAASVHHGGIGSTAQGLRSGRPCVIVPHAHDQFNNAARAQTLGCARIVRRSALNTRRLAAALDEAAGCADMRAASVRTAEAIAREDGAAAAAVEIEKLARR